MSAGYGLMSEPNQDRKGRRKSSTPLERELLGNLTLLVYIPKGYHFGKGHFAAS